jgi:hypothetical protein
MQIAAKTIKVRDARLILTEIYGILYFMCAIKIPVVLLFVVTSFLGASPPAFDLISTALPYLIFAAVVCGFVGAIAGAGTAWIITGRAMRSSKQERLRWVSAGALAAALPVLPLVAITPDAPILIVGGFLWLLLGGGIGFAFHWVVQRDRADKAQAT